MPIFELTPLMTDHPDWTASTWTGAVIVRAPSEAIARAAASIAFAIATAAVPGRNVPLNPWRQPIRARCEIRADAGYAEDGPVEILFPAGYTDELQGINWGEP